MSSSPRYEMSPEVVAALRRGLVDDRGRHLDGSVAPRRQCWGFVGDVLWDPATLLVESREDES